MTCSKTIHMYLTDILTLGMKTWQKSKVFLSFQLSSFPAMMINCSGSRNMRDKEVEKCFTQLSLTMTQMTLNHPKENKKHKKKHTQNKRTPPPPEKKTSQRKKKIPNNNKNPTNSHTQKTHHHTKASKFYVSQFWRLLKARRFFFHKFRSFVT